MANENENQESVSGALTNAGLQLATSTSAPATGDDFSSIANVAKNLQAMLEVAEVYVQGNLCPIKKKEDFVVAVVTGNQLGLPFTVSINHIFPINGKPAMSVHLIRALLLANGVTFDKVSDCVPIHQFFYANVEDGKKTAKLDGAGKPILAGTDAYTKIDHAMYMVNPTPSNYVTTYEFSRAVKKADGNFYTQKATSTFTYLDALKAELTEKDVWKKYLSNMLDARAFMKGAREVASDIIFGLYSIDELADANNVPYTMDDSMNQQVIDAEIVS